MWVAVLHVSQRTAVKIASEHGFGVDEVKEALVCVSGLVYTWDEDQQRGRRVIVDVVIGSRRTLAVLYPVSDSSHDQTSGASAASTSGTRTTSGLPGMMGSMDGDDDPFFEEDEPTEKIVAAFDRGNKHVTISPSSGANASLVVNGLSAGPFTRRGETNGAAVQQHL